jgi:hypothetical protein
VTALNPPAAVGRCGGGCKGCFLPVTATSIRELLPWHQPAPSVSSPPAAAAAVIIPAGPLPGTVAPALLLHLCALALCRKALWLAVTGSSSKHCKLPAAAKMTISLYLAAVQQGLPLRSNTCSCCKLHNMSCSCSLSAMAFLERSRVRSARSLPSGAGLLRLQDDRCSTRRQLERAERAHS